MNRTEILTIIVILLLSVTGCQDTAKQDRIKYDMTPGKVEVIVEGGGAFPDFLVGNWKGNKDQWGIAFAHDGSISEVRISLGSVKLVPSKKTILPTRDGGEAIYIPGDWTVVYMPKTHELAVRIMVSYINIGIGENSLIGKQEYTLEGTINEEGNIWETIVSDYPEFELLPTSPEDVPFTSEVVFAKVNLEI